MEKPVLSTNFTIQDIHTLRDLWNVDITLEKGEENDK